MTDLERVRRALGGIYKGEQERPGIRAAYEELDAHLNEDAEREALFEARTEQKAGALLRELRAELAALKREDYAAQVKDLQDELAELREAVRDAIETASRYPDEAYAQLRRGSRLRQLIEEKE